MKSENVDQFDFDSMLEVLDNELRELDLDIAVYKEVQSNLDALREEQAVAHKLLNEGTPESLEALRQHLSSLVEG